MNHLKSMLLASAVVCCTAVNAQTIVKVGLLGPLTGPQAVNGKDDESGLKMAIADLNKSGLVVGGQKIQFDLSSQDDQADPRIGVQLAQQLIDNHITAVFGPYNSGVAIPASKVFSQAGIPMLTVASNPSLTTQGFNNILRIGASDSQLGGTMAIFAATTLHAKTAAVVDDRTAYGEGVAEEFTKVAKAKGIKIVDQQYTNSTATDFLGILSAIKGKNPDVIFFGGYASQGAPMAKQMKQRGVRAKLLGGDGICSADMGKVAGDAAASVYCSQGGIALEGTAAGREFVKNYKAAYNTDTQVYAVSFYDGMMLLANAMKKAGTATDQPKILAELHKADYKGIAGVYKFDPTGDLLGAPTSVYQFANGLPVIYKK
jgi:branched-chain amino acid transport system substrate-binding protein